MSEPAKIQQVSAALRQVLDSHGIGGWSGWRSGILDKMARAAIEAMREQAISDKSS